MVVVVVPIAAALAVGVSTLVVGASTLAVGVSTLARTR